MKTVENVKTVPAGAITADGSRDFTSTFARAFTRAFARAFALADRLKAAHLSSFAEDRKAHAEALERVYEKFTEERAEGDLLALRCRYLECFAEQFPVVIKEGETVVGTCYHYAGLRRPLPFPLSNMGHFIANFETVLREGIAGLKKKALALPCDGGSVEANRAAFLRVLNAFSTYIRRYAEEAGRLSLTAEGEDLARLRGIRDDCSFIAENPPQTFRQALQLVWFTQIFLETEAKASAVSFGRIDRYLLPYYERDIAAGRLDEEEAFFRILCFCIKTCEGDESQMITLGGQDEEGNNGENPLTIFFLLAGAHLNMRQPSFGVRVRPDSGKDFLDAAAAMTAVGAGMPAYFNDTVLVKSLKLCGVADADAENYGIVGCYEASPQGAFSNTVAGAFNLYDSFSYFLAENLDAKFADFDAFLEAYKRSFESYYRHTLMPAFSNKLAKIMALRSPFLGCCLDGCLESGKLPEQLGSRYTLFGLNILGIGILVDSLYTVKKLVFERKETTVEELFTAAAQNFTDQALFEKIKGLDGTYGSHTEETDALAEELSAFIGKTVKENKLRDGVLVTPGLFWFTADIHQKNYPATLNGRRQGELLSYGVNPCATPHTNTPTLALLSTARIRGELFPTGCPAMLSLPPRDLKAGPFVQALVTTYFDCGGFHLAISGVDPETLEAAMREPDAHRDVMVKISGLSTQFVSLSKAMQESLLRRARDGV